MADSDGYGIVLSTCPDEETARHLARMLVEERLAACVSVVPGLHSYYWWKGTVESADEWLLLIKTRRDRYPKMEQRLREAHPYEVPEILRVDIQAGLQDYLDWLDQSVKEPS